MIEQALNIISFNANRQLAHTENALQIAVENNVDILMIQEPWFHGGTKRANWANSRMVAQQSFIQPPPITLLYTDLGLSLMSPNHSLLP
jgi:hypothetical protein